MVAILAYDMRFFEHLPRLFHNPQARSWYETTPEEIRTTALRNATCRALSDLAARAVGLDCGRCRASRTMRRWMPRSFPDGRFKSNFLCCLGHGDPRRCRSRTTASASTRSADALSGQDLPYTGTMPPRVTRFPARPGTRSSPRPPRPSARRVIGLRHRLAVGRRVHDRGRHRVDQDAVLGDFLGQRHGQRRDAGLAGRIGRHAGAAAPFQRRPRRDIDDAAAAARHRLHRRAAAQEAGRRDCCRAAPSARPCRCRRPAHREAAGDMDRGPQLRHAVIELRHRRLRRRDRRPRPASRSVAAMRKALRLGLVHDRARGNARRLRAARRPRRVPSAPVPPVTTTCRSLKSIGSASSALGARRQHLEFDPVRDLAGAQLLVEHVLADAVAPGQPLVSPDRGRACRGRRRSSRCPASSAKKPSSISRAPMRRTIAAISRSGYSG